MDTVALFANQAFFESVEHYSPQPHFAELLRTLLPAGWTLRRHGTWLFASDGQPVLPQGFKIHVTATPAHATALLRLVARECAAAATTFKVTADVALLHLLNARYARRGSSGKFMTIYPRSTEDFRRLVARLHEVTRDEPFTGPYVLSDRRYRDSRVLSFRYGGFLDRTRLNVDGSRTPLFEDADGSLVADVREVFYSLPPHVEDPFAGEVWPGEQEGPDDGLLHGRYRVTRPLRYSNAGGTYLAEDTRTGRDVVIKEARPHTSPWTHGTTSLDACDTRRAEWAALQRLRGVDWIPEPVEYFRAWEHEFLVEGFVRGATYWAFWADRRNILMPYVAQPARVAEFVHKFRVIARRLIRAVGEAHARGVLLGDISPQNIMVCPDDLGVYMVDLDGAVLLDGPDATSPVAAEFSRQWHTAGFLRAERAAGAALAPIDDWYAAGILLAGAVIPVQGFFALRGGPDFSFLDMMIGSGAPMAVRAVVDALVAGRPAEAAAIIDDDAAWARDDAPALPFATPVRAARPEVLA